MNSIARNPLANRPFPIAFGGPGAVTGMRAYCWPGFRRRRAWGLRLRVAGHRVCLGDILIELPRLQLNNWAGDGAAAVGASRLGLACGAVAAGLLVVLHGLVGLAGPDVAAGGRLVIGHLTGRVLAARGRVPGVGVGVEVLRVTRHQQRVRGDERGGPGVVLPRADVGQAGGGIGGAVLEPLAAGPARHRGPDGVAVGVVEPFGDGQGGRVDREGLGALLVPGEVVHRPGAGAGGDGLPAAYTPAGNLAGVTDAAGSNWAYSYNLAGEQTSQSDPDAGTTASVYDPAGLLTSTTDADGNQVSYVYDADGRASAEYDTTGGAAETPGDELDSWVWDTLAKGELTSSTSYYDGSAYTQKVIGYDGWGLSEGTETIIPSAQGALAGTYYNANTMYDAYTGQLEEYEDTAAGGLPAEEIREAYDTAGDPVSIGGNWAYVDSLTYTDLGQPLEYTSGSSAEPIWTVDSYGEQTGDLDQQETQTGTTPVTVDDQNYGYDNAGQITSDADNPAAGQAQDQCYQYDYLGRLSQAWSQGAAGCASGPSQSAESGAAAGYWEQYSYNDENDMTRLDPVGHPVLPARRPDRRRPRRRRGRGRVLPDR